MWSSFSYVSFCHLLPPAESLQLKDCSVKIKTPIHSDFPTGFNDNLPSERGWMFGIHLISVPFSKQWRTLGTLLFVLHQCPLGPRAGHLVITCNVTIDLTLVITGNNHHHHHHPPSSSWPWCRFAMKLPSILNFFQLFLAEPKAQSGQESLHSVFYALIPVQVLENAVNKHFNP